MNHWKSQAGVEGQPGIHAGTVLGGGGGSYAVAALPSVVITSGVNTGNGAVTFDSITSSPERSTYALLLGGFAAMGFMRRRRS